MVTAAGTLLVLLGASGVIDLAQETTNIVTVLALGLAVDYSLLMVSRFREERAADLDVPSAIERTSAAAGRTITFSALTVAVSLAGLFVFDDPTFRSFAVGGVGVVLVALLAALTLVPALLSTFARRVGSARRVPPDDGVFYRVTRRAQRHPLLVLLVVAGLLVASALPFLSARFQSAAIGFFRRPPSPARSRSCWRPGSPVRAPTLCSSSSPAPRRPTRASPRTRNRPGRCPTWRRCTCAPPRTGSP